RAAQAMGAHQNADGTIMVGATRSAALRDGDESALALRECAARACQLIPALAGCEVAHTWTGLRPFSPDGLPYIGPLADWLGGCPTAGIWPPGWWPAPATAARASSPAPAPAGWPPSWHSASSRTPTPSRSRRRASDGDRAAAGERVRPGRGGADHGRCLRAVR